MWVIEVYLHTKGGLEWIKWNYCKSMEEAYEDALSEEKSGNIFWRIRPDDESWKPEYGIFFDHKWFREDVGI